MKKKNWILILGIGSIIIFISVQLFIIGGIWRQKDEMFDLRYKTLSQEALAQLEKTKNTDGFDTALFIVNSYADTVMNKDIYSIKNEHDLETKKQEIFFDINKILVREQDLSQFLSAYFENQGFEKDFNIKIVINYLQLINFDTKLDIYQSPEYKKSLSPGSNRAGYTAPRLKSRILVTGLLAWIRRDPPIRRPSRAGRASSWRWS